MQTKADLFFTIMFMCFMSLDFARRVLENGPNPRNGNKTDQAHPPIHPTKYTDNLQVFITQTSCVDKLR